MLLLVGSEKGGSGKTTLSVNLAVMRALAGYDVLLVDTDEQGSAGMWGDLRNDGGIKPIIPCVRKVGRIATDLNAIRDKFDTVIVDAGGKDSTEMRQAMVVCDRMLIPLRPSQFDVFSMATMASLIRDIKSRLPQLKMDVMGVLNAVNANPNVVEAAGVRVALEEYKDELRTLKGHVTDRMTFQRTVRTGQGVAEVVSSDPSHRKAVEEMAALYKEVFNENWKQGPVRAEATRSKAG